MKHIVKGASPEDFESWKAFRKPTNWKDLLGSLPPENRREPDIPYYSKSQLREVLLEEQGYTCCYCEMRIFNNPLTSKIDHIEPREGDTQTERIFDYYNLAISCNGGERDPKPKILHCDTEKKNKYIKISPLNQRCETEITFTIEGKISGLTEDANHTISVLNLHIPKLNNLREAAIAGFIYLDEEKTQFIPKNDCNLLIINLQQNKKIPFKSAILRALHQIKGVSS